MALAGDRDASDSAGATSALSYPSGTGLFLLIIGAITIVRLVALALSPLDLGFDEAQYWAWSRDLALGYFTKPPLIAWAIAAQTQVCGDSAACVRALPPIMHAATAIILWRVGIRLYGRQTGFWAGIFYLTVPGIAVSSLLITTDVFLLFFWSIALWAFVAWLDKPRLGLAVAFGVATGLGLNAKYAMMFLPGIIALAAIFDGALRRRMHIGHAALALAIAGAMIAPNLIWNALNGFATITHTGDNVGWAFERLNAVKGFEFFIAQFGVAGPIVFGTMVNATVFGLRSEKPGTDRLLIWLSAPIIVMMMVQGFLSQANPNWGATAYPAGAVLATALILRHRWRPYFVITLVVNAIACLAVIALTLMGTVDNPPRILKALNHMHGWTETAQNLEPVIEETGADRVVTFGRPFTAGMIHALRDQSVEVRAYLDAGAAPTDQFQLTKPWQPSDERTGTLLIGAPPEIAEKLGAQLVTTVESHAYGTRDGTLAVYGF